MFDNFRPTKAELSAIREGVAALMDISGHDYRVTNAINDERRGVGNRSDRVPLAAAQGLATKWFLRGVENPNGLLRASYWCRPAALYLEGLGADHGTRERSAVDGSTFGFRLFKLRAALAAYEAAFNRMQAETTTELNKACRAHSAKAEG